MLTYSEAKLVVSYAMRDYLREKKVQTPGQLHQSLNNMDAMRLILEKRKALWYPEKTALSGVVWEYQRNHLYNKETVIQCKHHAIMF